jgi:hypothetical protein
LFGCILLFDVPENLAYVFLEPFVVSEYFLGSHSCYCSDFLFDGFIGYKIINISLDLVESYSAEITNSINYFGSFGTEQVSVKKNINIY